ncbi:MAG: site-specific integrase, partial [Jannaschia sp.]
FARGRGIHPLETLYLSDFNKKVSVDARDVRLAFNADDLALIARHPIWSGSKSRGRRNEPGEIVLRDGLYWGPVLAAYTGARREELLALAANDIVLDHDVPHILIRPNHNRNLKNPTSKRTIPIHSRLLELGFAEHARAQQVAGSLDLFPELKPESKTGSFGGSMYKGWKRALDQQLGRSAAKKSFHSFRHYVVTTLRHQLEVPKNVVTSIVGHAHHDETDGRYADHLPVELLVDGIERIPISF